MVWLLLAGNFAFLYPHRLVIIVNYQTGSAAISATTTQGDGSILSILRSPHSLRIKDLNVQISSSFLLFHDITQADCTFAYGGWMTWAPSLDGYGSNWSNSSAWPCASLCYVKFSTLMLYCLNLHKLKSVSGWVVWLELFFNSQLMFNSRAYKINLAS